MEGKERGGNGRGSGKHPLVVGTRNASMKDEERHVRIYTLYYRLREFPRVVSFCYLFSFRSSQAIASNFIFRIVVWFPILSHC